MHFGPCQSVIWNRKLHVVCGTRVASSFAFNHLINVTASPNIENKINSIGGCICVRGNGQQHPSWHSEWKSLVSRKWWTFLHIQNTGTRITTVAMHSAATVICFIIVESYVTSFIDFLLNKVFEKILSKLN